MSKVKHSKFKNTGVLFELLVRQITNDAINDVDNSPAVKIVRKFFNGTSMLKKDLNFYQMLKTESMASEAKANKFVDIVLIEQKNLNQAKLKSEKYNLIREIKNTYDLDLFFSTKISDYKVNASIYSLFEMNSLKSKSPLKTMASRNTLVEHIFKPKAKVLKSDKLLEAYKAESEDVRLLTYNILLEKFNSKYDGLNKGQKALLKNYINNVSNTGKLKEHVQLAISKITKSLGANLSKVDDKVIKVKLQEVIVQLLAINESKTIKDVQVLSIMRAHELAQEVYRVVK
tara:strand:- start:313 stop:1173 length:861 start_codon:yes stop_codon:yes gene_type:complete